MRVLGLELGTLRAARGAMFRSVLASRASEGRGGGSAQGRREGFAGIRCYVGPLRLPFGALTNPREESEDESSDPTEQR